LFLCRFDVQIGPQEDRPTRPGRVELTRKIEVARSKIQFVQHCALDFALLAVREFRFGPDKRRGDERAPALAVALHRIDALGGDSLEPIGIRDD